ncbi:cysteine desulfurase family protein [Pollutibacter soli]|uniref:cysteine desulfurase family protein n=1 Tax=Pollutibacter soli TaxID=3034157 RepID=UPI0030133052
MPIYLDNNATTLPDPRVVEKMLPFLTTHYGNAASATHFYGWEARDAVEEAREKLAGLLNADAKEMVFTSGATESINLALKGVMEQFSGKGSHLVICSTEHKAVLDTAKHLESSGKAVSIVPVNEQGIIDLVKLESAFRPDTVMAAVMLANNETGVIHPVNEIANITRKHGALFFCDATQAAGKIPIDVNILGIDLLACSAHKMYGPKGIGALYINKKSAASKLIAQMDGGGHERGFRSGTLNVPAIAAFGEAAEISRKEMDVDRQRISQLRDALEQKLTGSGNAYINGHPKIRMYNVTNISFPGLEPQRFMMALSKHIAVSSGSACTSVVQEPSYVLKAMGLNDERARNAFRFSLGRFTTEEEVYTAGDVVLQTLSRFRS